MNSGGIVQLQLWQFSLIYLLLIIVIAIMKKSGVEKTRLLVVASVKMTVQLVIAGLVLSYIFQNPNPVFVVVYLAVMVGFAVHRVLSGNPGLNRRFQIIIAASIALSGVFVLAYFVCAVVGENIFNPQYTIPLAGMLIGNTMTGISLGIKTFRESLQGQKARVEALLGFGASPRAILQPLAKQALETALLPTLNSMVGMGIVSLPGMMTGQLLAGADPLSAAKYQIVVMLMLSAANTVAIVTACFMTYRKRFAPDGYYLDEGIR